MTLGLDKDTSFLSSGNERLSSVIWLSLPLKDGETGYSSIEVSGTGLDRPSLQQEPCGFLCGGDVSDTAEPFGLHLDGLVPSFRVHGAAPRGVAG